MKKHLLEKTKHSPTSDETYKKLKSIADFREPKNSVSVQIFRIFQNAHFLLAAGKSRQG